MINVEEIDKTILSLEDRDTTFATCEKLAWLYIVRDHLTGSTVSRETTPHMSESEFMVVCSDVNIQDLLSVLNEHMEVIKVLYPKEYSLLVGRIKSLHDTH